jgi:hypothetical protein
LTQGIAPFNDTKGRETMTEALTQAERALANASDALRGALCEANAIEALVLLPLVHKVADARNELAALIAARDAV